MQSTMTDGDKVKEARKKCGLTQEKSARYFDVSLRTYTNWEGSDKINELKLTGILTKFEEYNVK